MADPHTLKTVFERNARALELRPSIGMKTGRTTVRVRDGTTCDIENGKWRFVADVGTESGGNDAGAGPGVLERAALGSCLAIGYAIWAARFGVTLDELTVEVESDFDARGSHGVADLPPGFGELRYHVTVRSPSAEAEVLRALDAADAHSAVLDDFRRPLPVSRTVSIHSFAETAR